MGPGEDTTGVRDRQRGPRLGHASSSLLGVIAVARSASPSACSSTGSRRRPPRRPIRSTRCGTSCSSRRSRSSSSSQAVVLYCVWKFRMRPGQELHDGPPIHGNTRLEVDLDDHPGGPHPRRSASTPTRSSTTSRRRRPTRCASTSSASSSPGPSSTRSRGGRADPLDPALPARGPAGAVQHPLRGRHPRLLGPGLPHEDRRGARRRHRLPRHAEPPRQLPGRLRRAVRPRPRLHAPDRARGHARRSSTRRCASCATGGGGGSAAGQAGQARPAAATAGETDAAAAARPSSPSHGCGGCHTLADAGTNGTTGPEPRRVLEGHDADEIRKSIVDPNAEVAEGFRPTSCPANYGDVPPEQLDALVDYLEETTPMTARCAAPGLPRAGLWLLHRRRRSRGCCCSSSTASTADAVAWEALPARGDDRRAAVRARRPRRFRLLVLLGVGPPDAPRGPLGPRRASRGRTTSASTPTTRSSGSSTSSPRSSSSSSAACWRCSCAPSSRSPGASSSTRTPTTGCSASTPRS